MYTHADTEKTFRISTKEFYVYAKKPYLSAKEPSTKELYTYAKEPYLSEK